jgi:2-polyprenyl-6-methoxyphenol hydroxylase-like FAD-dependent oxidoreductase
LIEEFPMSGNRTVLISGASIAGPALAHWLCRYGYRVTVVEKAPAPRPGGQAVDFKGRTHLGVLESMGLLDEIRRRQTGKTDVTIVDGGGARLARISGDWLGGDVEIRRGDLSAILYERTAGECEYLFGDSVAGLDDTGDGVTVRFDRAEPRRFDLVVGADGILSQVRRCAFGPERDHVRFRGYYYAVAGAPRGGHGPGADRGAARMYCEPGRSVTLDSAETGHMYIFASPEFDYARDDVDRQRRIVRDAFAGMGWEVPRMLAQLDTMDGFYLDAIARTVVDRYHSGRVVLLGDAACADTLGGFGTGLAIVGAYVPAGELAAAGGDHTVAFARYDARMRGYARKAGMSNPGPFLAPPSRLRIRMRNLTLNSTALWGLMLRMTDWFANDIELPAYPAPSSAAR